MRIAGISKRPFLNELTRHDLMPADCHPPTAFASRDLDLSPAAVRQLFYDLQKGTVPVLMHPFWNQGLRDSVLSQIPRWQVPDQSSVVVFTSGSSGLPKPCLLPISKLLINAEMSNQNLSLGEDDEWLLSLPIFHVGGLGILFRGWLSGARVSLHETPRTTHQSVVPTQLYRMLGEIPKRKAILLGGGATSKTIIDLALQQGAPLFRTYGMTEAGSQVCTTRPGAGYDQLMMSGFPLKGVQLTFENQRIRIKSPSLMQGYLGETSCDSLLTNDQGEMTEHGINILGRADRAFKSGGELIHPEQIERSLLSLPDVLEARVVAESHAEYGQVPVAFVLSSRPLDQIQGEAKEILNGLFRPHRILPWDQRPASGSVKERL